MTTTVKPMKICVLNISGNVGKTTVAVHLLASSRPGVKMLSVERENNSDANDVEGIEVEELNASQFKHIYREIMRSDDIILDVGASNVSLFMEELTRHSGSIGEFDLIVIPVVPDEKQQKDTIKTINWLLNLGIDAKKIRVVFNRFQGQSTINETYAHIMGFAITDGEKKAQWLPHVVLNENDVYDIATRERKTIRQMADDKTDWKAKRNEAKAAKDFDALDIAMDAEISTGLARSAYPNLEQAYEDLMAPYAVKGKK